MVPSSLAAGSLALALVLLAVTVRQSQRAAAQSAEHRDAWFGALVEHGADLILVIAPDGELQYASPAVTTLLGYEPAAVVSRNWLELVHPDDASRLAAVSATDARLRRRDGTWVEVEAVTTDARNDPAIGGLVVNARDLTERRRLEAIQADETELLGMIASRAPLQETLDRLARVVEQHADAAYCSILLVGTDGFRLRVGAAPRLPSRFVSALDGVPADDLL